MRPIFPFLLALLLAVTACSDRTPAERREAHLAKQKGDIVIAVAWPLTSAKKTLLEGVEMAAEEINAQGGVRGRKIQLLKIDDEASTSRGRLVAQQLADNPEVLAVIGHLNSHISIPASDIYEESGILMMTPGSSNQKLTERSLKLVFRNLPGNKAQGRQIANYFEQKGYKRVIIYYIKNEYGSDLSNAFEQRANELGIAIADRRSYEKVGENYSVVLEDWKSLYDFDAIFFAGSLPEGAKIIATARHIGITKPIVGGAGLDSLDLIRQGGKDVEGTIVFSLFHPENPNPEVANFSRQYAKRYKRLPESTAAQGYDALHILAAALQKAPKATPQSLAQTLRGQPEWRGATGIHRFDASGDVASKPLQITVVQEGQFRFVKSAE